MNVDSRYSGRLFEVAGNFLRNAIDAKAGKIDKKLKIIELQLKKKKLDQTLSPEEEVILQTSKSISRYGVGGGVAGAFSQEQIIGSAQALAEFEDAGRELTASEAAAATALGIPQAVLGTVSEGLFAASLFKLAFRKSPLGAAQNKQKLNQKLDSQEEKILDIAARKEKGAFVTKAEDDLYKEAVNPQKDFLFKGC